jgi:hypothetical protein
VTVPTKWQLAQHWYASPDRATFARWLEDLATPCCFACGWFSEHWVKATPKASWERAALERAHIVPASLDGPDDASNVLLLCAACHRDSPDWHKPDEMARWIAERPQRASKEVEELSDWCGAALQVPEFGELLTHVAAAPDFRVDAAAERLVGKVWQSTLKAATHASALSSGSKVAILRDATA